MIEVELTWFELHLAAQVGLKRQMEALRQSRPDRHGYDGKDGWTVHVEGAAGEMAVAKALGQYWNGSVNTYRDGADVGTLQVRTRSEHYYDLLIRPNDPDDARFVLVTGVAPHFRVHGWMQGGEAKQARFRKEYGGRPAAYFVPQGALHTMESVRMDEGPASKAGSASDPGVGGSIPSDSAWWRSTTLADRYRE